MKIKEASIQTGLTERTIRFYQQKELLSPASYRQNGKNFYDYSPEDIVRLNRLALLRRAGFSVEEIRQLFHEEISAQQLLQHRMTQLREEQTRSAFQMDLLQPLGKLPCRTGKGSEAAVLHRPSFRPGMGIRPRLLQIRSGNPGRKAKWLPGLSDFPAETRKTRKKAASNPTIAAPDSAGCRGNRTAVCPFLYPPSCLPEVGRGGIHPTDPGLGVKECLSGGYRNPPLVLPPAVYRISAH